MDRQFTVQERIWLGQSNTHGNIVLRALRDLVRRTRQMQPALAHCELTDVGLERQGDSLLVTLYFAP